MPRRALATLLAIALLPTALAATSFRYEISNATANETHFMKAFDAPATALADFDGDGRPELVAHNDNQYVYVLSTAEARVLAEFRPDYPAGWTVRPINDPAVADVDGDGRLDIVVVNSAGIVCDYEYTGGGSTGMTFERRWCTRMSAYDGEGTGADAGAWVEDVDGDGRKEIFSQTEKVGLFAFNADGRVRWSKAHPGGNAGPLVTDLDGDGRKEAVFFGDGGEVKAFDASSGSTKWQFWASNYVKPASIPVSGNAADLDGDGRKEVVFIARHAPWDQPDYQQDHFMLFVLSSSGSLKWTAQPSWGNPMSYTHPILHDLDGDGRRDILAMDWNTIGHKPGDWEKLGPANVFAYRHDGTLLWRVEIDNSWSNDDLALADPDGDGRLEVFAIGYGPNGDGVWYLDARTGAKETHVGVGSWTALRGPIVGNIDGSGRLGWAIPVHDSAKGGGYRLYRTDAPCVVAFGGWQNRDPCRGGASPPPPPPPPPPSGSFDASFRPTGGNEWWVQVKVTANEQLAGVDARVNGGAWRALSLRSWGDWAASFHVPSGSIVEFQARSTSGATETSGRYVWPSGASADGSTPPPSGSFDASFRNPRGNAWWVEVDVSATGGTLVGVDARVNGGAWTALAKQSWGSWAKSMSAPSGSTVEFRARAADGASDVSSGYRWPPG